jgi:uncharacterized protein YbbC (DUF1343 family)
MKHKILFFCVLMIFAAVNAAAQAPLSTDAQTKVRVRVGADVLLGDQFSLIKGKRVGLVTNHTALLSDGKHLADVLSARTDVKLTALFGPEHGIRGDAPDGKSINDSIDLKTGVKVYSLYGKVNKPTPAMLKDVDVLVYDIQDVGARFYTFISTLMLAEEAAAENNIPFVVLDRPNPIGGVYCDGPIRVDSVKSFVGWAPMPIAHGLTVGELAEMANGEGWLTNGVKANLTVVKMDGWTRARYYDELWLLWVKPSPNIRTIATALVYPGSCLIEGTNVSEGRGTDYPFETIGAPWINADSLASYLNAQKLPGVVFEPKVFTPHEIPGVSSPKFNKTECRGIFIRTTDRHAFEAVKSGIAVVSAIHALYPTLLTFRDKGFDRLAGTPRIREMIKAGDSVSEIAATWKGELVQFNQQRQKYFLYQ